MEEIVIKIDIPNEWKEDFKVILAKAVKDLVETSKLQLLKDKLESKEEKELTEWSIKLGREMKKGRLQRLLSELPKEQRKILNKKINKKEA